MKKLCEYGCGEKASFVLRNGKSCCAKHYNSCPNVRRKIGESKKGKVPKWKNGNPNKGGKPTWAAGKKYKDILGEDRAKEIGEKISKSLKDKGCGGVASTAEKEETRREKISQAIKKRYAQGWMPKAGRCKKIKYSSPIAGDVLLDGNWEFEFAKFLDKVKVNWKRNKNRFSYFYDNANRFYTPDFYLVDEKIYIEVKGYKTEKDDAKWNQFPHVLKIIMKDEIRLIKLGDFTLGRVPEWTIGSGCYPLGR